MVALHIIPTHCCSHTRIFLTPLVVSQQRLSTQLYQFHTSTHTQVFFWQKHYSQVTSRTLEHCNQNCHFIYASSGTGLDWTELLKTATADSYKPLDLTYGKKLLIVALLLTRDVTAGGHVTPPYSCIIQVFIAVAWQQRGGAMWRDEWFIHGSARVGYPRHSTEKTPLHLLLYNRGNISMLLFIHGINTPQYSSLIGLIKL
jgi:hypothetical protein